MPYNVNAILGTVSATLPSGAILGSGNAFSNIMAGRHIGNGFSNITTGRHIGQASAQQDLKRKSKKKPKNQDGYAILHLIAAM